MTTSDGGPKPVYTSLTMLNTVLTAATTKKSNANSLPFLILIVLFAIAYFVFLRPARNRQRQAATKRKTVEVGDEVTTTAGLIATVVAVDDDELTLEVAPGVHCRYLPAAVLRVNGPDEEPEDDAPDASTHEVIDPDVAPGGTDSAEEHAEEHADDHPDEPAPA
jgi:preprotein translocase subunit YajC